MKNIDSLKGIITALKQEDCVILIGSGISIWSGLPSWKSLLNELADFMEECGIDSSLVEREIAEGDLLQAASYGFDRLTKPQIETFMPRACRYGKAEPHEIHKKILDLGANCFITTNYDKLIEMGIEKWQGKKTDMVTNCQLAEMGRILQARAENFVYKPHGDIEDMESIILTREQYRSLLVDGERHMALETLKTLMVSRPLVCLGFGLKDPDFLYIRDILSNIYRGNVRDHYAIMADVEEAEVDYWERNYGIHLVGYETRMEPDGSRSHAPLLELLDTLQDELHGFAGTDSKAEKAGRTEIDKAKKEADQTWEEVMLAFVRYANRFRGYKKAETEFGIYVYRQSSDVMTRCFDKFDISFVEEFLTDSWGNAVLVGAPGAGKSYAMRRAAAVMAQELHKKCLEESGFSEKGIDFRQIIVPIYIDLKLYDGDLEGMIEREFSRTLPLERIMEECRCKIFLDSFNEMPKEYWDSGKYRQDFEKIFARFGNGAVVIGARTSDGLEAYGFPVYALDEIDPHTIDVELEKKGMTAELSKVMRKIISKPFYFQYVINGEIEIKNIAQPKHFYRELFGNLQKDFKRRFAEKAEIEKALSPAAYRALEIGVEAFPAEFIYEGMNEQDICQEMEEKKEVVNWLIYKKIITPCSNGKIAFAHQTITEYLAAKELMELYWKNPAVIREKMRFYRWDQAVFFMINLLPDDRVEEFINQLFRIDFILVLQSVPYMEFQKAGIINKIFKEIAENEDIRNRHWSRIESWLQYELDISEENEESIRDVIELGYRIGGAAAICLWKLKGDMVKDEFLQMLLEHAMEEMFCDKVGKVLSKIVEEADLEALEKMVDHLQTIIINYEMDWWRFRGFISAVADIMTKFDEEHIRDILVGDSEFAGLPAMRKRILCKYLQNKNTACSLMMATDLFMQGYQRASITMYFIMKYSSQNILWDFLQREHIDRLLDCLYDEVWALDTLGEILKNRTDLKEYVKRKAKSYSGLTRAAILACADQEKRAEVFQELKSLLFMDEKELEIQPIELLREIELTWEGKEELFVRLLMLKNAELMVGLMGSFSPFSIKGFGIWEVEDIDWWLDWMEELEQKGDEDKESLQLLQIRGFLTRYTGPKSKEGLLARFNDEGCPYRKILLKYIIPRLETHISDFHEGAIEYIFEELKKECWDREKYGFLARAADHKFIVEKLMPLLEEADGVFRTNLLDIIETAGRRHGKRYLV